MGSDRATSRDHEATSKVPAVTLLFWVIKIAATTLGEYAQRADATFAKLRASAAGFEPRSVFGR